jgi:hypothetical protein
MASEQAGFDRAELRLVYKALKNMEDGAKDAAKRQSGALAEYAQREISSTAQGRGKAAIRVATGSKVKKSSTTGEITYGYASQKFSGGGTTRDLWGGTEFGSLKFPNFPKWSGPNPSGRRGSRGYFIYPTLRRIQPKIVSEWTAAFDRILKEWT